jgi:hypothetical protein
MSSPKKSNDTTPIGRNHDCTRCPKAPVYQLAYNSKSPCFRLAHLWLPLQSHREPRVLNTRVYEHWCLLGEG